MNLLRKPMKKILLFLSLLVLTLMFATNTLAASAGLEQDAGPSQSHFEVWGLRAILCGQCQSFSIRSS